MKTLFCVYVYSAQYNRSQPTLVTAWDEEQARERVQAKLRQYESIKSVEVVCYTPDDVYEAV